MYHCARIMWINWDNYLLTSKKRNRNSKYLCPSRLFTNPDILILSHYFFEKNISVGHWGWNKWRRKHSPHLIAWLGPLGNGTSVPGGCWRGLRGPGAGCCIRRGMWSWCDWLPPGGWPRERWLMAPGPSSRVGGWLGLCLYWTQERKFPARKTDKTNAFHRIKK